ncbi:dihydrofolate reductase [Devosia sp. UYZn731]|uniref:dihydrofolate reductase family protein n=1 Tax=Devosia sp. UYZn731 TaxID=3156345 RepID=UPI0033977323
MNKLILQMQMSVDGFVGGDGQHRWQLWDWVGECPWDDELKRDFNATLASIGTILLSRKLAEQGYLTHWANAAKKFPRDSFYAFAQQITCVQKVILSRTLETSAWNRTRIAKGDIANAVEGLKRNDDGDIIAFGGAGLAASLIAARMVDEYQLFINPAVLTTGERLFDTTGFQNLDLVGSKSYDCGMVVNRYKNRR